LTIMRMVGDVEMGCVCECMFGIEAWLCRSMGVVSCYLFVDGE
jgi:hypothetical protein